MKRVTTFTISMLLAAVSAIASVESSGNTTSLTQVELWRTHGGDPVQYRTCAAIGFCNTPEAECSAFGNAVGCTNGQNAIKIAVNDEACNTYTGDAEDFCTEGSPQVCFRRWHCEWDSEDGCTRNEDPNIAGGNPVDTMAPASCEEGLEIGPPLEEGV